MLPLDGRRILITRSRWQASALAERLRALGAAPILIPTIDVVPPESFSSLDNAIAQSEHFEWLIFTSANAVEAFRQRLLNNQAQPPLTPVAAIGPATAQAAREANLNVALVPPQAVAESLTKALLSHIRPGSRLLLVRAAAARNLLPDALAAAGASLTIAEAYRTVIPHDSIDTLQRLFSDPARYPHAITFTSSSTAANLLNLLEAAGLSLPPDIVRASIGPITTQTLLDFNLPPHLEAPEATLLSLAEALSGYFTAPAFRSSDC